MTKITQKQLIEQLKILKEIKPRKEWAVLLKSQIFYEKQLELEVPQKQAKSVGIMDMLSSVFFQRKLAYAFAVVLFLIVGVFGFARYTVPGDLLFPVKKIAEQSQAALTGQTGFKNNVAILNNRINDLAQVAKEGKTDNIPSAIDEIKTNASELSKNLKDNPVQDPKTIKDIASSLKVLADVPGTDLTANSDVQNLTQTVVQDQIAYEKTRTLTDDQQIALSQAEDLYSQGKYEQALEGILAISN